MTLKVRNFAGSSDLGRMKELHRTLTRLDGPRGHWVSGRVEHVYLWGGYPDPEANIFLLEDPVVDLAAYAITYYPESAYIRLVVHPEWRSDTEIKPFLGILEEHVVGGFSDGKKSGEIAVSTGVHDSDDWLKSLIRSSGYEIHSQGGNPCYIRELTSAEIPNVSLPEQYSVRVINDEGWIPERVRAQQAGFDGNPVMTEENWKRCREGEYYKEGIDLVVWHEEDKVVAGCLCLCDREEKAAELEDVFTVPQHRRLGLGKAMLYAAFRALREKGIQQVIVRTGRGIAANSLYQGVGMKLLSREVGHRKFCKGSG